MNTNIVLMSLISRIICEPLMANSLCSEEDYSLLDDSEAIINKNPNEDISIQESFVIVDKYDLWTSDEYVREEIKRVEAYRSSGYFSRLWNKLLDLLEIFSYKFSCTRQKYVMNDKVRQHLLRKIKDIREFMKEDSQFSLLVNYIIVSVVSSKLKSSLQYLVLAVDMMKRVDTNNMIFQFIEQLSVRQFLPKEVVDSNQTFLEYVDQKISSIDKFKYENAKFEDFLVKVVAPIFNDILSCYDRVPRELL